jgi:hypothetical protein
LSSLESTDEKSYEDGKETVVQFHEPRTNALDGYSLTQGQKSYRKASILVAVVQLDYEVDGGVQGLYKQVSPGKLRFL